jgi:hypothetical protein
MTTSPVGISADSTLPADGVQCTSLAPVNRALTLRNTAAADSDGYVQSASSAATNSTRPRSKAKRLSSGQSGSSRVKYLNSSNVTRLSGGPRPTGKAAAQYWFYANLLNASSYVPQVSLYA